MMASKLAVKEHSDIRHIFLVDFEPRTPLDTLVDSGEERGFQMSTILYGSQSDIHSNLIITINVSNV